MKYRLRIIDNNVCLPKDINKEYNSGDEAWSNLFNFVHSFDGKEQVDGAIYAVWEDIDWKNNGKGLLYDNMEDTGDYCSSIM